MTLHNFRNSTCSTALENFSGLKAEISRSYSQKKIRWFIQAIFQWFSQGGNKVQDEYNVIRQCTIFLFKHLFGELDSGHKCLVIVDFDALLKKPEAMNKKKDLKFSMATS